MRALACPLSFYRRVLSLHACLFSSHAHSLTLRTLALASFDAQCASGKGARKKKNKKPLAPFSQPSADVLRAVV